MQRWRFAIWYLAILPLAARLLVELGLYASRTPAGRPGDLIESRDGSVHLVACDRVYVSKAPTTFRPLATLPGALPRMLLYQEDQAFYEHRGFSAREIRIAIWEYLIGDAPLRGASTISQQLARTLFLSQRRSLRRKLIEFRMARVLEARLSKDRILELYLNHVYWGGQAFGVDSASRQYFGVAPQNLNREQVAFLVSLLPSPALCHGSAPCAHPVIRRRADRLLQHVLPES